VYLCCHGFNPFLSCQAQLYRGNGFECYSFAGRRVLCLAKLGGRFQGWSNGERLDETKRRPSKTHVGCGKQIQTPLQMRVIKTSEERIANTSLPGGLPRNVGQESARQCRTHCAYHVSAHSKYCKQFWPSCLESKKSGHGVRK